MGALSPEELDVALRRRGADVVAWREDVRRRGSPRAAATSACTSSSTPAWGGSGRAIPPRPTRVAEAVDGAPGLRLAGVMTHFATADDDPEFMPSSSRASSPGPIVRRPRHAANSAATLGEPAARLDMIRCGIAIYGMDPFHRDPADHGLEPALELSATSPRSSARARASASGYGRRFIAERDTWIGTIPIGYGDGFRRGLTEPLRGRSSASAASGRRHGLDGQHHRRPRRRAGRARHRGRPDRRARRAHPRRGLGARARHDQLRDHVRHQRARAAARTRERGARGRAGEALAGEDAWLVGGAVRDRLLGRDTDDVDLAVPGDPKPLRAQARAGGRGRGVRAQRRVRRLAGGRAASTPGTSTSSRCATTTSTPTSPSATSRSTRWPSRSAAASCSTRTAAGRTWPEPARADGLRAGARGRPAAQPAGDPDRGRARPRRSTPPPAARSSANAPGIERVAAERVFAELKRVVSADAVLRGLRADGRARADRRRPARAERAQGHRAEPLPPPRRLRPHARGARRGDPARRPAAAEPLSDELTRGEAMRWAALLHDAAKPQTRGVLPGGRVTFIGHDAAGAELASDVLGRLRSSAKLRDYVAALILHHLDAGFLVHQRPLDRRTIWRYLRDTQALQRRHHDLHRRRPPGDPRPQRRAGDRGAPRGRAHAARRGARARPRRRWCAATS